MPPPGYGIHSAALPKELNGLLLAVLGMVAPDFWKKHSPSYEEYMAFFDRCQGAPTYEQVLLICSSDHGGTHFGPDPSITNQANFSLLHDLFNTGRLDAKNIFFHGYVHHLLTDKLFYSNKRICNQKKYNTDSAIDKKAAHAKLCEDWNYTNEQILEWFPEVKSIIILLPPKVQEIIQVKHGTPTYVSLEHMKHFIEFMRQPRTLEQLLAEGENIV